MVYNHKVEGGGDLSDEAVRDIERIVETAKELGVYQPRDPSVVIQEDNQGKPKEVEADFYHPTLLALLMRLNEERDVTLFSSDGKWEIDIDAAQNLFEKSLGRVPANDIKLGRFATLESKQKKAQKIGDDRCFHWLPVARRVCSLRNNHAGSHR